MNLRLLRRLSVVQLKALALALVAHSSFFVAVLVMGCALSGAMQLGYGHLHGWGMWLADLALALSFPVSHSLLLSRSGGETLRRFGKGLETTVFVLVSSLSLLSVFILWSPSDEIVFEAHGGLRGVLFIMYLASWLLLLRAMYESGLGVQLGYLGWVSIFRGERPKFPKPAVTGLHSVCRHPIYFSFLLILWTGVAISSDRIILNLVWSVYLLLGPLLKERRLLSRYGEQYLEYRRRVPYFPGLPRSLA